MPDVFLPCLNKDDDDDDDEFWIEESSKKLCNSVRLELNLVFISYEEGMTERSRLDK